MPKIVFRCNTKASYFAYPPPLEDKKKVEVEKVEVAVLSTTNKKKGGEKKKEQGFVLNFREINNFSLKNQKKWKSMSLRTRHILMIRRSRMKGLIFL